MGQNLSKNVASIKNSFLLERCYISVSSWVPSVSSWVPLFVSHPLCTFSPGFRKCFWWLKVWTYNIPFINFLKVTFSTMFVYVIWFSYLHNGFIWPVAKLSPIPFLCSELLWLFLLTPLTSGTFTIVAGSYSSEQPPSCEGAAMPQWPS